MRSKDDVREMVALAESCPGNCRAVANIDRSAYAYLLGQYLGDGHIVHNDRGVYRIRIYC